MDQNTKILKLPTTKNLNDHHWTDEEKVFKGKQKTFKKTAPFQITLRSVLLYKLSKTFFGTFLQELNRNDYQDFINNDNKWQIIKWHLKRYGEHGLKVINNRNNFIQGCYELVEQSVNIGDKFDLKLLERKLKSLKLNCIFIKQIDNSLQNFIKLKVLILCGNYFNDFPGKFLPRNLQFLELYDNFIEVLMDFVKKPPKTLRHLGLGRNKLNDDSQLHLLGSNNNFPFLTSIDLSDNELSNLEFTLKSLNNFKYLKSLSLEGNPCAILPGYKTKILQHLPNLLYLDATEILKNDRILTNIDQKELPHVIFQCFRIMGLPEPPKDKKCLQTIHVEVNLPLLINKNFEGNFYEEADLIINNKNSQKTNKNNNNKSKTASELKKPQKRKTKSYYSGENEHDPKKPVNKWFKTERMLWSKIIEFSPIQITDDDINLNNIRNTFRSNVAIRIVYLKFSSEPDKKKSTNSNTNFNKRMSKTIPAIPKRLFNGLTILPAQQDEPEGTILKKITLASFYCELKQVNWSDKTLDFYWTEHPESGDKALRIENGSLKELEYDLESSKKTKKLSDENGSKKELLPNVLTCQVGFGLN